MAKRYRYILCGLVQPTDKISDFRLIAGNNIKPSYNGMTAIRVVIPDDLELTKYSCDPYSTTDDSRTLEELGHDVLVWNRYNSKWEVHNEFKGIDPCDIHLSPKKKEKNINEH